MIELKVTCNRCGKSLHFKDELVSSDILTLLDRKGWNTLQECDSEGHIMTFANFCSLECLREWKNRRAFLKNELLPPTASFDERESDETDKNTPETLRKLVEWYAYGETGTSSDTIAFVLGGGGAARPNCYCSVPLDIGDFGRCHKLLEAIPEWRDRMPEVAERFPAWTRLVENWNKLSQLYVELQSNEKMNSTERYYEFDKVIKPLVGYEKC